MYRPVEINCMYMDVICRRQGHLSALYGHLFTSCEGHVQQTSGLLCFQPVWKQTPASTQPMVVLLTTRQHIESAGHTGWTSLTHLVADQMLFREFAYVCVCMSAHERNVCVWGQLSATDLWPRWICLVKCSGILQENQRINDNGETPSQSPPQGPAAAN